MRVVTTAYDGPAIHGANGVRTLPSGLYTARVPINGIHHYIYLPCCPPVPIDTLAVVSFY